MTTQIDWCNRCAAAIYAEDGVGGACTCPEGQLRQLLAMVSPKARAAAPKVAAAPQRPATPRGPLKVVVPQELASSQSLASMFVRDGSAAPDMVSDNDLQGLWSTEPGEEILDGTAVTASEAAGGLEALWMGRVANEMGSHATRDSDLESLWMQELQAGPVASGPNDISFDDVGFDEELSRFRGSPNRSAAFRVDRGPPPQRVYDPPVVRETRSVMSRTEARQMAAQRVPAAYRPAPPPPARPSSAIDRAAEYSSRVTAYQRLMSDD